MTEEIDLLGPLLDHAPTAVTTAGHRRFVLVMDGYRRPHAPSAQRDEVPVPDINEEALLAISP
jgi:hypothetical protein